MNWMVVCYVQVTRVVHQNEDTKGQTWPLVDVDGVLHTYSRFERVEKLSSLE